MRYLAILLLCLTGCTSTGVYRVTYEDGPGSYTAYALTPTSLISLHHKRVKPGHRGTIHTLRGPVSCEVVESRGEVVELLSSEPLVPGDSGAAVTCKCHGVHALIWGRPKK